VAKFEILYYNSKNPGQVGQAAECLLQGQSDDSCQLAVLENMVANKEIYCTHSKATSRMGGLVQRGIKSKFFYIAASCGE